ncbi:MAG: universal stress protein [Bacteroidota bacterium]
MESFAIDKILVPVDFSVNSINELSLACAIASNHNAAIHLLQVADSDDDICKPSYHEIAHDFAGTTKKLREFGKSVAAIFKINCICSAEYGSVTHIILKKAKQLHADLVVMGKNGLSGPSVLFAGTDVCQVATKSEIPVLIVPDKIARFNFTRVLFPLRSLNNMLGKYYRIRPLIAKNQAFVTILSLRNPRDADELHIIHALGKLIKEKLQTDGIAWSIEYYCKDDQFAEKVLGEANDPEKKYDLTVIISDHQPAQGPFQFGQYEQHVIHRSKTPLLLLHSNGVFLPGEFDPTGKQNEEIINFE